MCGPAALLHFAFLRHHLLMPFDILLYEPEIPPNTGNIIRLCANSGARLHLIQPLGFDWDNARLRRAGLDYHDLANVTLYSNLDHCLTTLQPNRVFACSTRGTQDHSAPSYRSGDALLFGPETRGLPTEVLHSVPPQQRLRIPMQRQSRSLNLSNAVAVVLYEAWRQLDFAGASCSSGTDH